MIRGTRIGRRTVWLIDEPVQARGRRRVLLAVDTSDSCWPRRQEQVDAAIRSVIGGLQAHDECWLWIMGREAPSFQARLPDDTEGARGALLHSLRARLVAEEGGTWLRETATAMLAAAETAADLIDYLLVITDGVVFDAEAVPSPTVGSAAAIYRLLGEDAGPRSCGADVASAVPGWCAAPANLGAWLAVERAEVRIELSGNTGPAYRFDAEGRIGPVPVVWPDSLAGSRARYAVLSETSPELRVSTVRGHRTWTDVVGGDNRLAFRLDDLPRDLRDVATRVWGLHLDWRAELFETLARPLDTTIPCPNCGATYSARDVRLGTHVFCELCRAFLLVEGWARRGDPALRDAVAVCWDAERGARVVSDSSPECSPGIVIELDRIRF